VSILDLGRLGWTNKKINLNFNECLLSQLFNIPFQYAKIHRYIANITEAVTYPRGKKGAGNRVDIVLHHCHGVRAPEII